MKTNGSIAKGSLSSLLFWMIILSGHSQPSNDMFTNRVVLIGTNFVTVGSNVDATKEAAEPDHADNAGGASVWWEWTAPCDAAVTVRTTGSSFDTLLAVYTGDSIATLMNVVSNDDDPEGQDFTSAVVFNASSNETHQIVVDGYAGDTGDVRLEVELGPPVVEPFNNDMFADRIVITGTNVIATGSNVGATKESGEPNHAGKVGGASVWWEWTAPFSGNATITTTGSSFDTLL